MPRQEVISWTRNTEQVSQCDMIKTRTLGLVYLEDAVGGAVTSYLVILIIVPETPDRAVWVQVGTLRFVPG